MTTQIPAPRQPCARRLHTCNALPVARTRAFVLPVLPEPTAGRAEALAALAEGIVAQLVRTTALALAAAIDEAAADAGR